MVHAVALDRQAVSEARGWLAEAPKPHKFLVDLLAVHRHAHRHGPRDGVLTNTPAACCCAVIFRAEVWKSALERSGPAHGASLLHAAATPRG